MTTEILPDVRLPEAPCYHGDKRTRKPRSQAYLYGLEKIIAEKRLMQSDISRDLKIDKPQLCRLVKRRKSCSLNVAVELADYLGVSIDDLLKDEDDEC